MIDAKAAIMSNALDIAREMARLFEAGMSAEESIFAVRDAFPSATVAELQQACLVGRDQMAMWQKTANDDAVAIFEMVARGVSEANIKASLAKRRAETIFPMKPE
jgi:hypothetical protein